MKGKGGTQMRGEGGGGYKIKLVVQKRKEGYKK